MLKLLIVDDEPLILAGLEHMIRLENTMFTEIKSVSDAFDALEMIDSFKPDLVITDIQMPAMDGLELIREAQQRNVNRFVILTGYDLFDYAQKAVRLQVKDYLLKPIQQRELFAMLNRIALEVLEERKNKPIELEDSISAEASIDTKVQSAAIRKFDDFIRRHFMQDISLDEVAKHLDLHPNYVCGILKRETGLTFVRFLHEVRIENAKELLRHPDSLTIEQVAKSVGYESPRHFYKVFKQFTGVTPGNYKNEITKS
jgi:two-component system response regulator YesN